MSVIAVPVSAMTKDDAKRFRERACECRKISEEAESSEWRESLLALAQGLEDEAAIMEADSPDAT